MLSVFQRPWSRMFSRAVPDSSVMVLPSILKNLSDALSTCPCPRWSARSWCLGFPCYSWCSLLSARQPVFLLMTQFTRDLSPFAKPNLKPQRRKYVRIIWTGFTMLSLVTTNEAWQLWNWSFLVDRKFIWILSPSKTVEPTEGEKHHHGSHIRA